MVCLGTPLQALMVTMRTATKTALLIAWRCTVTVGLPIALRTHGKLDMRKWWRSHVTARQQERLCDYALAAFIAGAATYCLVVAL
jgi:hypothetical protein